MKNSKIILYNLNKQSTNPNYKFKDIYRNLYNEDFYIQAYQKIYANKGSLTNGIDDKNADGFSKDIITELIEELKTEKYQPKPSKRINIPKSNGKDRPIGIPTFKDKLLQAVVKEILNAIYIDNFSKSSHGFIENRSCHTALEEIKVQFTGVNWFIEGDIESFFDNINHNILIEILRIKIKDERFLRLIRKFLNAGYVENWKFNKTYSGTPQGGIISPILSNIYLNEFDKWFEDTLENEINKGTAKSRNRNPEYRSLEHRIGKLKKRIDSDNSITENEKISLRKQYKEMRENLLKLPYYEQTNNNFSKIKMVRYADDFIIGVHGNKELAIQVKNRIKKYLDENLKIKLSDEKTKITNSKDEAIFLDYSITIRNDKSTKKVNGLQRRTRNGKVLLQVPKHTIEKIIKEKGLVTNLNDKQWIPTHRGYLVGLSDLEIVETYNAEIRGYYNYYYLAENVSQKMGQLNYIMEYSCLKTLACKYKSTIGKMKRKYSISNNGWGIKYSTKNGDKVAYYYNNGFKRKRSNKTTDNSIDNIPNRYLYQARGEMEQRLNAGKCEICNQTDKKYEVHHINKLKSLKGKAHWEKMMLARKRKTLIVCVECHDKIHNGTL